MQTLHEVVSLPSKGSRARMEEEDERLSDSPVLSESSAVESVNAGKSRHVSNGMISATAESTQSHHAYDYSSMDDLTNRLAMPHWVKREIKRNHQYSQGKKWYDPRALWPSSTDQQIKRFARSESLRNSPHKSAGPLHSAETFARTALAMANT
eukprot:4582258-Amphidinium_carterae.1